MTFAAGAPIDIIPTNQVNVAATSAATAVTLAPITGRSTFVSGISLSMVSAASTVTVQPSISNLNSGNNIAWFQQVTSTPGSGVPVVLTFSPALGINAGSSASLNIPASNVASASVAGSIWGYYV